MNGMMFRLFYDARDVFKCFDTLAKEIPLETVTITREDILFTCSDRTLYLRNRELYTSIIHQGVCSRLYVNMADFLFTKLHTATKEVFLKDLSLALDTTRVKVTKDQIRVEQELERNPGSPGCMKDYYVFLLTRGKGITIDKLDLGDFTIQHDYRPVKVMEVNND